MKTSLHRILSVLIVSTTLLLQGVSPRLAYSDDSFDRGEIQNALKDYYDHYAGRNTGDTQFLGTDRDRLTRVVARQLITLEANLFNDMVGHMIAVDYRQSPADREAIEKLVASMENEGRGTVFQTAKGAEEKAAMTVLADTVAVWSVACLAIGFGRSWAQADEMTGFERFAYVMKNTPEQMPKALKTKLAIAGLSLAVGASHAAYDYLYQTRFDPREALERIQDQIIQELAEKADQYRRALQPGQKAENLKQLEASRQDLLSMEEQVTQLSNDDPEFQGRLSTVAEDISASKTEVEKLLSQLPSESGLRASRNAG